MKIYLTGRLLEAAKACTLREDGNPWHAVRAKHRPEVPYQTKKDEKGYYVEGDERLAKELGAVPMAAAQPAKIKKAS